MRLTSSTYRFSVMSSFIPLVNIYRNTYVGGMLNIYVGDMLNMCFSVTHFKYLSV